MNALLAFAWPISEAVVERLGWVLLHSLWQFALVALLAQFAVRALRQNSAAARYGVLVIAMAVSAGLPVATWTLQPGDASNPAGRRGASAPGQEEIALNSSATGKSPLATQSTLVNDPTVEDPAPDLAASIATSEALPAASTPPLADVPSASSWSERATAVLRPWLAWLVAGWSLGVVLCALRPLLGWHILRRLRRVGVSPVPDDVLAAMRRISARLGLHGAVQILQSSLAHVPVVVGYLRPVILLPVSLVTSIPAGQLDAILAHELAHVRRHDFVVNLLQTLVETLFFYHPAVWWLSGWIRVEREHCCDDLVVSLLGNRVEYSRALLAIEQSRSRNMVLALGAADGSLISRVRRIVGFPSDRAAVRVSDRWPVALVSLACLGVATVLSTSWSLAARDNGAKEPEPAIVKLPGDIAVELVSPAQPQRPRRVGAMDSIEGEVVDAVTGKPVEGATVRYRFQKRQRLPDETGEPVAELVFRNVGKFTFQLPDAVDARSDLIVERTVEHPDYQSPRPEGQPLHFVLKGEPNLAREFIRKVALTPGKVVTGQVLDLNGRPAQGVPVIAARDRHGWQTGYEQKATTDADGRYRLVVPADQGRGRIYVIPNHAAAVERAISTDFGEQPVFKLLRGTRLSGSVNDARGRGIAGVVIRADGGDRVPWRFAITDAHGRYSLPPCQYGQYVVELLNEGWIPELKTTGVRLPDVYVPHVLELPKAAPAEQRLDFSPTESVRVTARYSTSDDQPVTGRILTLHASQPGWSGTFTDVPDEAGLYELRVPHGAAGRIDLNHDQGHFLRIVRQSSDDTPLPQTDPTTFDQDGILFHVRRYKAGSVTLRPVFDGKPVRITGQFAFPQFADQKAAQQFGARLASTQSKEPENGGRWFDVHPDIDILLKLEVRGFQPWQETVRIAEGQDRVIDMALEQEPALEAIAPNGEIVGRLLDAVTGQPVEGATIACGAIINDSGKGGGANAITDARGRYRLPVPSPGIYNVWLKTFDKDPSTTAAADDGVLVESGKVATSQLRLVTGRKVAGKAVDSDGQPFENLTVSCYSAARPHSGGVQSSKTETDGSFEFSLPPGRAYIYVSEQVKPTRDNPFGTGRSAHAHLQVPASGNVSPLKLTLQKTEPKFGDTEWLNRSTPGTQIVRREGNQDVTGTVVDEAGTPIAGAKLFREDGPIVLTNDKGEFRMESMKGTQFVMHAFAPGCHVWFGTPTSGDVLRIVLEMKRPPPAGREKPKTTGTPPPIRIWTAILVDGKTDTPLQGISVQARGAKENEKEPRLMSFKSDASGRVEVPLIDGTGTTLQVTAAGWWVGNWPYIGYFPQAEGSKASQPAGDSTKPVTIKLWKGTHVTGKLMSPDGKPASGVALNAGVYLNNQEWKRRLGMSLTHYSWDHSDWPNWNAQVVTTADGTFEATVPPPDARGWVRVGTTQLGFGPIAPAGLDAVGPGKGLFQFAPFETEVGGLRAAQLPEEDGRLDLGTLQLERGIVLKGRVLDADGQPLTGVTLLTSGKRGPYAGWSAVSGENGRFEFLPMNPGGCTVSADARLRNEKGDVRSRDVQAVFVPLEVTLPETGEAREIVVRAVAHVTVEFEWIDRRTKKGPVSFYGEFTVTGRVPREGTSPASWRGETEKIERDGRELLMMKIPASLTNATLNLPADSVVIASYADDQIQSGPGQVELGDVSINRRRVIYGDEPKQAKPTTPDRIPTDNVDKSK